MQKVNDFVIIGSGPAAMSAAIYAARDKKAPLVLERDNMGGLAATISKIENYPGFIGTGAELMQTMRSQAESFGAKFDYGEITKLAQSDAGIDLEIDGDEHLLARAVLVATGTERVRLGIPGEDLPGVSYCATCDGPLIHGQNVLVIGGGNSAVQEAFYLLKFCNKATLLVRSRLRCDDTLRERLEHEPRISVELGVIPTKIEQADQELSVISEDGRTFSAHNIFIFIGQRPATTFLPAEVLAKDSSIVTDKNYMTKIPGLFAAGDCRYESVHQVVTATGEGAAAAVAIRNYLK